LQTKFDSLTIEKAEIQARLDRVVEENTTIRNLIADKPHSDPVFLQSEVIRLSKALDSKTSDFNYLAERYQEASSSAARSAGEVKDLQMQVESLTRRMETDVKAVTWEGEKRALKEKLKALQERCR